jgi:hypothetical protein
VSERERGRREGRERKSDQTVWERERERERERKRKREKATGGGREGENFLKLSICLLEGRQK